MNNYATELTELKTKINQLTNILHALVEQIKTTLAALHAPRTSETNAMELENETNLATTMPHITNSPMTQLDLLPIINNLKHDIAMIAQETRAMFQQYVPPNSNL